MVTITAQSKLSKNEILVIDSLTNGMDKFYSNPLKFKDRLPKALLVTDSLIKVYPKDLSLLKVKAEIMRYNFYFVRTSQQDDSIFNYIKTHERLRLTLNDSCNMSVVDRNWSAFWKQKSNYEKGIESIDKAYATAKKCNDTTSIYITRISKIKAVYTNNRANDSLRNWTKTELKKLLNEVNRLKILRCQGTITNALATIYIYEKQYDSVGKYLRIAEKVFLERNDVLGQKSVNRRLASYYKRGENNIPKALVYYKKSLEINERLGDQVALIKNYLGLSNTYQQIGDSKKALYYYKKHAEVKEQVKTLENYRKIVDLEVNHEYSRKKQFDSLAFVQEKRILAVQTEKDSYKKKLYLVLLTISLIFGLIIAIFFRKRWLKAKQQKENMKDRFAKITVKKNERINELNHDINNLSDQIDLKKIEITKLMTKSIQEIASKEKLVKDLKKMRSGEKHSAISSIIANLKSEAPTESQVFLIKKQLEDINFDFLEKLQLKHPNLTKTDLEICSYIRLGIERKVIAQLRFTTTNAVKKSRNRLRKRLNLNLDDDLDQYINSF